MSELIRDKRQLASQPKEDRWDSLSRYSGFKDYAASHLTEDTQKWLDEELKEIDKYEKEDIAYPKSSNRPHYAKEDYDRFRQEKIDKAINKDLSHIDDKTLADLEADFASIDEDEQKDYANPHTIKNKHTREEYNKFREEAVAKAFRKIGKAAEIAANQPKPSESPPQSSESSSESSEPSTQPSELPPKPESNPEPTPTDEPEPESSQPKESEPKESNPHPNPEAVKDAKQAATEQDKIEAIRSAKIEAIKNAKAAAIKDAKNKAAESAKAGAIEVEFDTQEELALAIARTQAEIAEKKARLREIKAARSLIAINADFTHDKKELARDYAEKELNAELAESNFVKRLWKGDLFKKYYWKKYEKAIFTGKRKVHLDGESLELDQIIEKRSHDAISRFVEGVLDDPETSRFVHRNIGKNGENGEKLEAADEKTTERVRQQIRDTIKSIEPGLNETEFIRQFREKAKQTAAESRDKKTPETTVALYDNYAEVAYRAYQLADQHESLDRVMEGFKVYNAEVRNNQRTEAHRDFADRIIEKLENSSIGLVVPAESIAIAVSAVSSLAKHGGALLGFGLGTASALSGFRERNRLADERTRVMRTAAIGIPIAEQLHLKDMSDRKRAKYETKIGGRYYKIESAADLFNNFYAAYKKQDTEAMLDALAEIKVRIDYSDSEQKDLIAYSSADRMGKERLALDRTIIEAEKLLFKESELVTKKQAKNNEESFKSIERVIQRRIDEEVQASDKKFNRYRLGRAALRAGKTLALGATFALTAQEIVASISPSKVGIFEKAGLIHHQNNSDATETFLAGFIKSRNIESGYTGEIANIAQGDEVAYQKAGYDIVQTSDGFTGATTPRPENISIHDATGIKSNLRWADNSTAYADGNELGLHIDQAKGAFFTNVTGSSSLSTGEIVDVAGNVARGNASLLVKIGGKTFESIPISIDQTTGQALFGQNGYISTTTGELIQIIGSNGERLFDTAQLVINDGIASDSTHLFTAIATITGDGAVGDILKTTSDIVENLPTYTAVPPYSR